MRRLVVCWKDVAGIVWWYAIKVVIFQSNNANMICSEGTQFT